MAASLLPIRRAMALCSFFLFFYGGISAQDISKYIFTKPTATYVSLSSPTIPTLTGTTNDGYYNNGNSGIPIGFDFWYMGAKYTSFSISTNGWIALKADVSNSLPNNSLANNRPYIAPLWDDLRIQPGIINLLLAGDIGYTLSGAEGTRVLTVQWRDMEWSATSASRISFQVKLYEENGVIRFSYSRINDIAPTLSPGASIGISGGANQFASVTVASPNSASSVSYSVENTGVVLKPATNDNFNFASIVTAPTNLSFSAIGPERLTLNWLDNSADNTGYVVYRSSSASTGFQQIGTILGANATSYTDTGLSPSTRYYYKVFALREALSTALTGDAATTACPQTYPSGILVNYRYNSNANDELATNNGQFNGGTASFATDRFGNTNRAYSLNGTSNYMSTSNAYSSPSVFTISCWFKTTTTDGGKLISFGDAQTGTSTAHDRHIYMVPNGRLYFGVYPNVVRTINSTTSYNDGNWHHVVGILSASGIFLYVDGVLSASNNTVTTAQTYTGYWRVGYDRMDNSWTDWPSNARTQAYFNGAIDDVLIYNRALSAAEVTNLYQPTFVATTTAPICAGYTFNLNAPLVVGATYSWSGPNGFTSTQQNPSGIELNANTIGIYTVTLTAPSGCSNLTSTVRVSPLETDMGLWAGRKDANWSNQTNWCGLVAPTNTVNVTIPTSGPTYNPTVSTAVNANNLTVQSGRTLTINSGGDLRVSGTLTSTNSIDVTAGKLTLNGAAAQIIPANIFSSNTIKDVEFNNSAGVTLNGSLRITGLLTATAAAFNANGFLTLASSESNTANVAPIGSGASIQGLVKVERFLKGGSINPYRTNRMLSSPVYDNTTSFINTNIEGNRSAKFAQLIDDVIISGAGGSASGFDVTASGDASAWTYSSGFVPIPNINTQVNAGKGMYIYFRGNRENFQQKTNAPYIDPENTVIDFDGVLNQGDVTVTLPTGGHLLGNPYASVIDWDAASWGTDRVNVNNAIWIWNPATRSYATYTNGVGSLGGSRYIQSGQSFFVQTTAAGSIKFKEAIKVVPVSQPTLIMSSNGKTDDLALAENENAIPLLNQLLRVKFKPLASFGEDETVLAFKHGANPAYTPDDALHLDGEVVNLSTMVGTRKLAINFMPLPPSSTEIPLHVAAANSGNYLLNFNLEDFTGSHQLKLKDNYLQTFTPISQGKLYHFSIDKNVASTFGANRFSILVEPPAVLPLLIKSFAAKVKTEGVALSWTTEISEPSAQLLLYRMDLSGNYHLMETFADNVNKNQTFLDSAPSIGKNYYKLALLNRNGEEVQTVFAVADFGVVSDYEVKVYPNPVTDHLFVKATTLKGTFLLTLSDVTGKVLKNLMASDHDFNKGILLDVLGLNSGVYILSIENLKVGEIVLSKKIIKQ
ncbi:LamG-like jellyroll fold domain-containing protein [Nubsella zeaxanthinifaciens]|uniref:LamG-like jellyroll fold domain-containing protein n=1 Tax=Nubsella zeaxanthinifaciens TaxID=392412 RepID=UPI000DE57121|nr:LamG-like jellyroll fold domain-containing protein [Nubsella zeaxanthinifaciens]